MVRLAIFDNAIRSQLRTKPDGLGDVQVVVASDDLKRMPPDGQRVDAVIVGLDQLGDDPEAAVVELVERYNADMAIVLYHFAKRDLIARLGTGRARALRIPVQLGALRMHLVGLLVRDIFRDAQSAPARA